MTCLFLKLIWKQYVKHKENLNIQGFLALKAFLNIQQLQ